jgi:hypothetical protein
MVERCARKQNCCGGRRLLVARDIFKRSVRTFSTIFPRILSRVLGSLLFGLISRLSGSNRPGCSYCKYLMCAVISSMWTCSERDRSSRGSRSGGGGGGFGAALKKFVTFWVTLLKKRLSKVVVRNLMDLLENLGKTVCFFLGGIEYLVLV